MFVRLLFMFALVAMLSACDSKPEPWTAMIQHTESASPLRKYYLGDQYNTVHECRAAAESEVDKLIERHQARVVTELFADVNELVLFRSEVRFYCGQKCRPGGCDVMQFVPLPAKTTSTPTPEPLRGPVHELQFADIHLKRCVRATAEENAWMEPEQFRELSCKKKGIASLEGIEQLPNLVSLDVSGNELSDLPLAQNAALVELNIANNRVRRLPLDDLSQLHVLDASNNGYHSLDLSSLEQLRELTLNFNGLLSLHISGLHLQKLHLKGNSLRELDLSSFTQLKSLDLSRNGFEQIDLSMLSELKELRIEDNDLETLDISANQKLELIRDKGNRLNGSYVCEPVCQFILK